MPSNSSVDVIRTPRARWVAAFGLTLIPIVLALGFGHSGVHAARSFLIPGAGLLEAEPVAAAAFVIAAGAATAAWLLWGADWLLAVVVAASAVASAACGSLTHGVASAAGVGAPQLQSHEFPLVLLFIALAGWARATLSGVPGFGWLAGRRRRPTPRTLADLPVPERCRTVAVLALANALDEHSLAAIQTPDVARRARRVGKTARFRFGGDPLRRDHAHTRAALKLCGLLDGPDGDRFTSDARRSRFGVPCSEPTWVRPLDATLVNLSFADVEDGLPPRRSLFAQSGPFALRRGHRAAWVWTPLGLSGGRCRDWEHALVSVLSHSRGWTGTQDWSALRQRVLGAAARGCERSDDERLVAAGRVWLNFVDDTAAAAVLGRPTVEHDPMAVAIDQLAEHLRANHWPHATEEHRTP